MDALTLALALRLDGMRIRPVRVALGALAGTLAARLIRALAFSRARQAVFWLPVAGLMALAAGWRGRALPAGALLVMSAAGLLGGVTLALTGATGSRPAAYALAALCAGVTAARGIREAGRLRVVIRYRGRQAVFPALHDSGNSLRDYLTRLPVIVLPEAAARERLGLHGVALRPIFAQTAGGRLMMWCFLPDEAFVLRGRRRKGVRAAVALSPGLPSASPALLPGALLGRRAGVEKNVEK